MQDIFSKFASKVSKLSGSRYTFMAAILLIVGWIISGFYFDWSDSNSLFINTVTTIITFLMVFLIQNTQNRDTEALQIKLDEIIRSITNARNQVLNLEELDEQELDEIREEYLKLAEKARKKIDERVTKK